MKVLLVNGSPRANGNTARALIEVADTLEAEGLETETAWIGNKPVRGCVACGKCRENGSGRCAFDDDVANRIIEMLNCPVVGSQYWNVAFGRAEGECAKDGEGMQTMRTLARNMAWIVKNLRRDGAVPRHADEPWQPMNFIR